MANLQKQETALELQLKEAKQAAEVEKIHSEVRKTIYNGLLKVLHARGDKGYLRAESGDDGIELLLSSTEVLKTHAAAVRAAAESYVRTMTLNENGRPVLSVPGPESNANPRNNGHQSMRHVGYRNAPAPNNPVAPEGMIDSQQGLPGPSYTYHFQHPLGAATFKLYDQVLQPNGQTVNLYNGWFDMVRAITTAWEMGTLLQEAPPPKPWTVGSFPPGIIFSLGGLARKVDPALYGGSNEEDLLLCHLTFNAAEVCPLGRFCCFRHDPLSADEIRWILFKKGKEFLEVYMLFYTAGGPPEMTGIPVFPSAASFYQPALILPNLAPLPHQMPAASRATSEMPTVMEGRAHGGEVTARPPAANGLAVVVPSYQNGIPTPEITPTAIPPQPTPGLNVFHISNELEKHPGSISNIPAAASELKSEPTTSKALMMSMGADKNKNIAVEAPAASRLRTLAPKPQVPEAVCKKPSQLTIMGAENTTISTSASLPVPQVITAKMPTPMMQGMPTPSSPSLQLTYPPPSSALNAPSPYRDGFRWIAPKPANYVETPYVSPYANPVIDPQLQVAENTMVFVMPAKKNETRKRKEMTSSAGGSEVMKRGRGRPRKSD